MMVSAPPRPQDRAWHQHRREKQYRLLEPGWGGQLDDDELVYIQDKLRADDKLAFAWGFRPGQKTRSEAAVRRVAMDGDPDSRATNVNLARRPGAGTSAKSPR